MSKTSSNPGYLILAGRMEYVAAWALQCQLVTARKCGLIPDTLLLLEHPHTITIGRSGSLAEVLVRPAELEAEGVAIHRVDRGGHITYHGPGQIVGYAFVQLRNRGSDVRQYLRDLEEVIIRTLADVGLEAGRDPVHTGVWIGGAKIAAIGVHVSGGVTSHGFALNIAPDLSLFDRIIPCGISTREVTSVARLLETTPKLDTIAELVAARFGEVFDLDLSPAPASIARLLEKSGNGVGETGQLEHLGAPVLSG